MGDMIDCSNCGKPAYRFALCQNCGKDPMVLAETEE